MSVDTERADWIAKEMRTCVHFNGIQNDACKGGVGYRDLIGGSDLGWACRIPCILTDKSVNVVPCAKREYPSQEVAEAYVDEARAHITETLRKIEAGEDTPGVIICGGRTKEGSCPSSVDGRCPECGVAVESIYGLGSGYGGCGGYSYCPKCCATYDYTEDNDE